VLGTIIRLLLYFSLGAKILQINRGFMMMWAWSHFWGVTL